MPFDVLEPLGPDACRSDRSAPCAYWHLKLRALDGDRDKLSPRELAFVGVGSTATPRRRDGWHQPSDLPALAAFENDAVDGSSTDALILRAFMAIGTHANADFLGEWNDPRDQRSPAPGSGIRRPRSQWSRERRQ